MDLIGDIVEKEVDDAIAPSFPESSGSFTGFPKPVVKSTWKQRQAKKKNNNNNNLNYDNLSEAEKIHLENIEILSNMTEAERIREKEELLGSMDPRILQKLLLRSEEKLSKKKSVNPVPEFKGYGDWIGGDKNGEEWKDQTLDEEAVDMALGIKSSLKIEDKDQTPKPTKSVSFDPVSTVKYPDDGAPDPEWEDVEDLDDIAPESYQLVKEADEVSKEEAISNVHFLKPEVVDEDDIYIDINDPDFNEKLHEKYFPDLPRDTEKLKWMTPIPDVAIDDMVFDNVSDLRFDFKGDLVVPNAEQSVDTSTGLHHHTDNVSLAGYTLRELAHLSRSSMSSQRCIAIRTLGRILLKLGKGKYNIPDADAMKRANTEFDQTFWGLIDELRVIETLEEAADEQATKNLSVRNYAIEALWLWKQGGGNTRHAN
ncbi:Rba50p CYBJADRAFT_147884 [Cyberlindnera jadinii NRRL Y-1542]|uniref:RNA polymerase II-associated protein RBA50 n=1 Tax=Cyberlindnera jadinii (strain ATCC 18201 / CBS 1600 / BCRC 20928 / JCM 3617 / NBRC 0987 / NRRL Y-1542) TaxID=983966 RepID=A0A1E4S808_CYBJN|nr:hypothetical protein CYBJADRAFT_147884 [Cyberlindnera jadinii NRRL Y-1542]ODV75620.1 hypothetical protein CYBJADRAFT_147884 [Cyberlindnera jadinii NRRL Y-1542]